MDQIINQPSTVVTSFIGLVDPLFAHLRAQLAASLKRNLRCSQGEWGLSLGTYMQGWFLAGSGCPAPLGRLCPHTSRSHSSRGTAGGRSDLGHRTGARTGRPWARHHNAPAGFPSSAHRRSGASGWALSRWDKKKAFDCEPRTMQHVVQDPMPGLLAFLLLMSVKEASAP